MNEFFSTSMNTNNYGTLYGVGTGPGDPELLTRKGYRILTETPVIFVPKKSEGKRSFVSSILQEVIDPTKQKIIELVFPMTKDAAKLAQSWNENVNTIYQSLKTGKDCAFATEGDPFFYSTFLYIFKLFEEQYPLVPIEVIPGITSVNAAACQSLTPLSENKGKTAIIPAVYHVSHLHDLIQQFDTLVLLKIHSVIDTIITGITEYGPTLEITFVQKCGRPDELILRDITSLKKIHPDYFSLLIIKKITKRGNTL